MMRKTIHLCGLFFVVFFIILLPAHSFAENSKLSANKQSTSQLKKEFMKESQGLTAEDWLKKALTLLRTNPEKAIEYLNNAIKLQPDYTAAYNNRGAAYAKLGQHQQAIEDFNEVIRLRPDLASAYLNRGLAYDKLGQYQQAITDYSNAISLKPNDASAYGHRGIVCVLQGNYKLACRDARKACKLGNCELLELSKSQGLCR